MGQHPPQLLSPPRDSLLTTTTTGFGGLLNLIKILLFVSNARAALENIIKYGILVEPFQWISFLIEGSKHWPALIILAICCGHCFISFAIERLIAYRWFGLEERNGNSNSNNSNHHNNNNHKQIAITRNQSVIMLANAFLIANLLLCLIIPPVVVFSCHTHPISASASLIIVSVVFLKLVSFHMMNFWCRDSKRPPELRSRTTIGFLRNYVPARIEFGPDQKKQAIGPATPTSSASPSINHSKDEIKRASMDVLSKYPNNLKMDEFLMYLVYPTLSYELEYARTSRIRKRFLIKRTLEVIILSQLDMALIQQWIVPTVNNSLIPLREMQLSHMLERLLKLAIPNHVIWMIWFYTFFHSLLNIQAELTRFADREFYRDWWNSESVHYFWSHWNIPVHKWCARHLYLPLMAIGFNKFYAGTAVFFVSAFFHEYLVSVPLKIFRIWAFTGMLIQLPWARFVSSYFNNNAANIAVWLSIILGQPLCILMYYHDYYVINRIN